jgi:hypothetical protein
LKPRTSNRLTSKEERAITGVLLLTNTPNGNNASWLSRDPLMIVAARYENGNVFVPDSILDGTKKWYN